MLVQQGADRGAVGDDAGDVRRGREGADLEGAGGILLQSFSQDRQRDVPVEVLGDDDDVGDRLAPRQLVGVVLVGADEDDRPGLRRDVPAEVMGVLEGAGDAQAEDPDELVDGTRAPRAGEDDDGVLVAADGVADDRPGILAQPGGLQAGAGGLGVRVGVAGQDLVADEVLDERQRPAGGGVVGVGHPARAVRPREHLVVADDALPDGAQQRAVHVARIAPRLPSPPRDNRRLCMPLMVAALPAPGADTCLHPTPAPTAGVAARAARSRRSARGARCRRPRPPP